MVELTGGETNTTTGPLIGGEELLVGQKPPSPKVSVIAPSKTPPGAKAPTGNFTEKPPGKQVPPGSKLPPGFTQQPPGKKVPPSSQAPKVNVTQQPPGKQVPPGSKAPTGNFTQKPPGKQASPDSPAPKGNFTGRPPFKQQVGVWSPRRALARAGTPSSALIMRHAPEGPAALPKRARPPSQHLAPRCCACSRCS